MSAFKAYKDLVAKLHSEFAIMDSKEEVNKAQHLRVRNMINECRKLSAAAKAESVSICKG